MLAIFGSLCVLTACGGFGLLVARQYRRRPAELRALRSLLGHLETEVDYAAPLPEALRGIAGRVPGGAGRLALAAAERLGGGTGATAAEAWAGAIESVDPETAWTESDRAALLDLGSALGGSGRDDQLRHIRLCSARIEALEAEASEAAVRQSRLWTYMGFLAGVGLLIALL